MFCKKIVNTLLGKEPRALDIDAKKFGLDKPSALKIASKKYRLEDSPLSKVPPNRLRLEDGYQSLLDRKK